MKQREYLKRDSAEAFRRRLLRKKAERYHLIGAWAAAILVLLWSFLDYYTFRNHFTEFVILRSIVTGIILGAIWLFKKKVLGSEDFGMAVVLPIAIMSAYMQGLATESEFILNIIGFASLFVCAGMVLVWPLRYSLTFVTLAALSTVGAWYLLSPLSIGEVMAHGGMLLLTVMVIFVIQVKARFDLILKEVQATARLRASEHQHRLLFAHNPVPMLIYDLKSLTIVEVNNAMCSKYGYSEEALRSMTMLQFVSIDDQQRLEDEICNARNGQASMSEWQHHTKDGTPIFVQTVTRSISYRGRKCRIALFVDVTKEKELTKRLIRSKEEVEEAKKAQEQFFANISHEIRTPMNGVLGMTRLLKEMPDKKHRMEYLDAIEVSAINLLSLVNDILDISKMGAGKMEVEQIPFSLRRLTRTLAITFSQIVKEKDISIRWRFDNRIPKLLVGDPLRINQIINNLVSNAIKFTSVGGVSIEMKAEEIEKDKAVISCAVSDTGAGIEKEHLNRIFEKYDQAGKDISRKHGGTGLGLAITKQLVDLMDGKIEVKSHLKKGTTFTVRIPLGIAEEKTLENKNEKENHAQPASQSLTPLDILLVEDNKINQVLAKTVLEKRGFKVDVSGSGERALEKLRSASYDLVLLDIDLPGMSGLDVVAEIRKSATMKDLPVVAMTASTLKSDIQPCLDAGMDDYVPKPFEPDDLFECIEKNTLRRSA